jgi:hypothetical protein
MMYDLYALSVRTQSDMTCAGVGGLDPAVGQETQFGASGGITTAKRERTHVGTRNQPPPEPRELSVKKRLQPGWHIHDIASTGRQKHFQRVREDTSWTVRPIPLDDIDSSLTNVRLLLIHIATQQTNTKVPTPGQSVERTNNVAVGAGHTDGVVH